VRAPTQARISVAIKNGIKSMSIAVGGGGGWEGTSVERENGRGEERESLGGQ
jgi:hypothetical protein